MGLDMYILRVKRPKLENKVYTANELYSADYSMVSVEDARNESSMFAQLLPYTVIRNVLTEYYDKEKMIAYYNLPKNSYIGMQSYDGISISGTNDKGERVSQFISREDIEKNYTITKSIPHYIWKSSEEEYWRKHYELQDWFYDNLKDVDNCGYYILNAEQIAEMNERFNENVAEDDPTDEEALFYHEWY